jgi:DNA-binding transcriptional ArsR family regulator
VLQPSVDAAVAPELALIVESADTVEPGIAFARPPRRGRRAPARVHPDVRALDALDALFKGFAEPARLRILSALVAGELCVSDIVVVLGLPQSLVSRHLAYLRRTGLVTATRDARQQRYRLADASGPVHESLLACVRGCFTGVAMLEAERSAAAERVRR